MNAAEARALAMLRRAQKTDRWGYRRRLRRALRTIRRAAGSGEGRTSCEIWRVHPYEAELADALRGLGYVVDIRRIMPGPFSPIVPVLHVEWGDAAARPC